jgi:hypothetical protein
MAPQLEGYSKVAHLQSAYLEFAIFRRFRILNMENLLLLQAEIIHLESELQDIISEDFQHSERQYHPYDWWSLSQGLGEEDTWQWEKRLEIREKLEKYSMFIIIYASNTY